MNMTYSQIGNYYGRKMVVVNISENGYNWTQPFYQTTGQNGRQKDTWIPFLGCLAKKELYWCYRWVVKRCVIPPYENIHDIFHPSYWQSLIGIDTKEKEQKFFQDNAWYPKYGNIITEDHWKNFAIYEEIAIILSKESFTDFKEIQDPDVVNKTMYNYEASLCAQCKNCVHWESYMSFYEDELESHDCGFCDITKKLIHHNWEETCSNYSNM